jgi:hypothetical protein
MFPKSITIGNRKVPVNVVDYDSPSYKWHDDDFRIEINKKADKKVQEERFYQGLVSATMDYLKLLDELKREVDDEADISDMAGMSLGKAIARVISDNKLG